MKAVFSPGYEDSQEEILEIIGHFDEKGKMLGPGKRNKIKIFESGGKRLNVKSFKVPNAVNQVAYRFFRKSKAERSFLYAHELRKRGIGTPFPVAYLEKQSPVNFSKSFYISEHLEYDLTFWELLQNQDFPQRKELLRAFSRFTFELHEKEVQFLDHSPGNTLIKINEGNYAFFLVDLNRMNFKPLNFEERMRNFSRLTSKKEIVAEMSSEYALLYDKSEQEVYEKMWFYTQQFQKKFYGKRKFKKKLKFWKSSK